MNLKYLHFGKPPFNKNNWEFVTEIMERFKNQRIEDWNEAIEAFAKKYWESNWNSYRRL